MKLLFLGASNTDCDHCFSKDNLGYGYVKMVHDLLLQKAISPSSSKLSEFTTAKSSSFLLVNGGTDGFTFPRIFQKWDRTWRETAFDAVFVLGGINEVGALMDSGMTQKAQQELLHHSADTLTALLTGILCSECPRIFVLEPFLFDTPAYLKAWMEMLEKVREMIRKTVLSCGGNVLSESDTLSDICHLPANRVFSLALQPLLDDAVRRHGILSITKDGIHLAPEGHRIVAEMLTALISKF